MKSYLNYCLTLFITAGLLLSPFALYSHSAGEYLPAKKVAEKQLTSNEKVVYGTALHDIKIDYKNYMLGKIHPKIVSLGSSRVMQFRDYMFSKQFYNLGGVMTSVHRGVNFAPRIIKEAPDLVIIGADIWWFNEKFHSLNYHRWEKPIKNSGDVSPKFKFNDILSIAKWYLKGRISTKEISNQIFIGGRHIGIAGLRGDGFGPDGTQYYTRTMIGEKVSQDIKFSDTLRMVNSGVDKFLYSSVANNQHVDRFTRLVKTMENNKIHVIIFLPPFAPEVYARMNELEDKYSYINELRGKLKARGIIFHDFTNPSTLGSNSCEFIDGFHGGEVTYLRILDAIGKTDPHLKRYIDQDYLTYLIEQNKGLAFRPDEGITESLEIDFLDIGCNKQPALQDPQASFAVNYSK